MKFWQFNDVVVSLRDKLHGKCGLSHSKQSCLAIKDYVIGWFYGYLSDLTFNLVGPQSQLSCAVRAAYSLPNAITWFHVF